MHDDGTRSRFEAVFAEVYEPLQRYLRRRCTPHDADDVLDEALVTLWWRIDDVPADGVLPWAYGVARRCLANHRRGDGRRLRLTQRLAASTDGPERYAWAGVIDGPLQDALDELSGLDREVVQLWAWEQLEPREIAEVLGTSAGAVSVRLHRVQGRLRSALARKDPAPAGQERAEHDSELER